MNWQRVRHLMKKEFLQMRRDQYMLRIIIIMPIMQLFIFGYAVTTDVRHIDTAVLDEDRTAESRLITERFARTGYFELRHWLAQEHEIDRLMDAGEAQVVIRIPRGFAVDVARGRTAALQLILDGSDSMTASIVSGYAAGVVGEYAAGIAAERIDRMKARVGRLPEVRSSTRVWFNQELKSVNYMVPGVLAMILMLVTMIMTSMAIVKEREIGTLEQLVVTPIKPLELIIGKSVPFIVVGYVVISLVLLVARFWFRVPIAGSAPLLLALSGAFMLSNLGMGLFISTISQNQQQASMTTVFFVMPSILLSGFIFPVENMPEAIRWVPHLIPMHYYLVIVRGIFLKGNGIDVLWRPLVILLCFGVAVLGLSSLRFRKRLG